MGKPLLPTLAVSPSRLQHRIQAHAPGHWDRPEGVERAILVHLQGGLKDEGRSGVLHIHLFPWETALFTKQV